MKSLLALLFALPIALAIPPHPHALALRQSPSPSPSLTPSPPPLPTNWSTTHVTTSSTSFLVSAQPFRFGGANMYWLTNRTSDWVDAALSNASSLGMPVVRTWFFNDGWFMRIDEATGDMGFDEEAMGQLDYVLDSARRHGVKLICTLANNWHDFGGVHYYITHTNFTYHDDFMRQPALIALFKTYITHVLNRVNKYNGVRFGDDPTVFAWEIMNEPRCLSYTEIKSPNCSTSTMTSWLDEISTHIKSLSPKTMVTIGDEGWLNDPSLVDNWLYDGFNGIDFDANLGLKNIDFGTFHTYPDHGWGAGTTGYYLSFEWGEQWIRQHKAIGTKHNKPVINEEYGWSAVSDRLSFQQLYFSISEDIGIAGDLFWQFWIAPPDGSPIPAGDAQNASYTPGLNVYATDPDWAVFQQHNWNMLQWGRGEGDFNESCWGARNILCAE